MAEKKRITPRPASEDDIDQVAAIEAYSNGPSWGKAAFKAELSKKSSHFWVLTDDETDEEVFGYVVFSFPHEQAHIQTLAVKKQARRQGHATDLLRAVINYVLRNEGDSVVLEVRKSNIGALAMYQQLGFVVIHTVKNCYPDGEDGYSLIYRFNRDASKKTEEEDSAPESHEEEAPKDERPKNIN